MKKKRSFLIPILLIIDISLFVVIFKSAAAERERKKFDDFIFSDVKVSDSSSEDVETNSKEPVQDVEEGLPYTQEEASDEGMGSEYNVEEIEGIVDIEDDESVSAVDYSTDAKPSLSDFMWYFDGVYANGIPSDAVFIYDSELLTGDWKGFIFYDPERIMNSYALEFMNVNLDISGQVANVKFSLHQYCPENSEIIDVSGETLSYSGNFEAGAVFASGGGNVHIDSFYTMSDKKQYAVGYIDTVDGTPAYIALVRP